ncbi:ADP-dependent NAD(P)H-hydrate dehydratase [Homoserinimonas aerilata]|uniref:ADP-dependent NAD(P)H-hydrate dehydratase n=1 Tax=Homoserinimonas aerilata TaxID=1162970 RepID=UPI0011510957|nr:ADP/ATP-dependent (S)-NAD(P)H-hydrate dehydratase [Homoserinimonas aerilata]
MEAFVEWSPSDAATMIARPGAHDDKYSRGVLGVMTGSEQYPGAAVLGVDSALRTGVGMVRYRGPERATNLVLQRHPEAVTAEGRVQAWLLGSGMGEPDDDMRRMLLDALSEKVPTVVDAGALGLLGHASGPVVATPHARELGRLLGVEPDEISADPARWCAVAAERLGAVVLLKGSRTHVAGPRGTRLACAEATPWLATAGTGDALGGILGALLATHSAGLAGGGEEAERMLVRLAATASLVHSLAALRASGGAPFTVLELNAAIPQTVAGLLSGIAE